MNLLPQTVALVLGASLLLAGPTRAETALVEDNLPSCINEIGSGSGPAVLAYELAHSQILDQLFYRDQSPAQKLDLARARLAEQVSVPELRRFASHWRADFDTVARRLEVLHGRPASPAVSMWYSLDRRVGVLGSVNGTPTLGLNARPLLPYNASRTRLAFAAEIFRYQASQGQIDEPEALTLSRRFQVAGLTLAAMEAAVPGLPMARYLGVDEAGFAAYQQNRRAIGRGLLEALQRPESAQAVQRFFGRGTGDPWPAGAGRYAALMAAHAVARRHDFLELYGLPSRDYLFQAIPTLQDLAGVKDGWAPP